MKSKLIKILDIIKYMVAGVGLFSLLNLIFKEYSELPALLVLIGLGLGLLMWRRETKAMREMDFGGNINALKFYVYLFTLFVYVLAIFGYVEFFALVFGQSSIEVYKSLSFSWEWVIALLFYFVGWSASTEMTIEDAMKNANMQKA
jgi:hypothetical protein